MNDYEYYTHTCMSITIKPCRIIQLYDLLLFMILNFFKPLTPCVDMGEEFKTNYVYVQSLLYR